jgi:hypothetical protein
VHWGTFALALHNWTEPAERVMRAAAKHGLPVALPRPGESFEPRAPQQVLGQRWWPDVAWSTAEESPLVSTGLGT